LNASGHGGGPKKQLNEEDLVRIATLYYSFPTWRRGDPLPVEFISLSGTGKAEISGQTFATFDKLTEGTSFFSAVARSPVSKVTTGLKGIQGNSEKGSEQNFGQKLWSKLSLILLSVLLAVLIFSTSDASS
jgi:hypothetical protein